MPPVVEWEEVRSERNQIRRMNSNSANVIAGFEREVKENERLRSHRGLGMIPISGTSVMKHSLMDMLATASLKALDELG